MVSWADGYTSKTHDVDNTDDGRRDIFHFLSFGFN